MYIIIEYGAPHLSNELTESTPNRLAIMTKSWENCYAFDKDFEYTLKPSQNKTFSLLDKLLAHTFYNPKEDIKYVWQKEGAFKLEKAKNLILKGLEEDDDIIQQHLDGKSIIALMEKAIDFKSLQKTIAIICGKDISNSEI